MTTFTFTLPLDAPREFGYEGRSILARSLNGASNVGPLFHYQESGLPCDVGMPMVRIRSTGRHMNIVTLDEAATLIVLSNMPAIMKGISAQCGAEPVVSFKHEEVLIKPCEVPHLYKAHNVVLMRGLDACARFEQTSPEGRRAIAHEVLCRGLVRQADCLGLDLPDFPSVFGVEVQNVVPRAPIIFGANNKVLEHGVVADLLFSWDAKLKGSWAVGGLTSRGNGRVWYAGGYSESARNE